MRRKIDRAPSAASARVAAATDKLLAILEAQRQLRHPSYPVTLGRLIELAGDSEKATLAGMQPALKTGRILVSRPLAAKGGDADQVLVLMAPDAAEVARSERLLLAVLGDARNRDGGSFEPKELTKMVSEPLREHFAKALDERLSARSLPAGIGAIRRKKSNLVFMIDDMLTAGPSPPPSVIAADGRGEDDFEAKFGAAFDRLDCASGSVNYVSLAALRGAFPELRRDDFDAALTTLRRAQRFTLDASDGRHDRLTEEQRAAGIMEAGNLLVYVARRAGP